MKIIIKTLKNRYIKDNIIFMSGTVLAGFLGFLFHFFVARKLTVSAFGEVQSVFSLVAMTGVIASAFSYFIIKYASLFAANNDYFANDQFISALNKRVAAVIVAVSIILLALSPLIKNLLHLSDIWGIVGGIIAVFFGTVSVIFQESLRAWQKFLALTAIGTLGAAAKLVFGYGLAIISGKASPVVFSLAIGSFLGWIAAIYFWKKLKRTAGQESDKSWREYVSRKKIWKNALRILFYSFASALILNVDILIVKNLTTAEMTGYYSALSVLGKIILLLNMSIAGVALPRACQDGHRGRRLQSKVFFLSFFLMLVIGATLIAVYYFFPTLLVTILFGQKYQAISGNLWIFGVMALVLSLFKFEADLAFAWHDFRINYVLLLTAGIMFFAIYQFHDTLSDIAASVSASLLTGYILVIILNNIRVGKKTAEPLI